MAVCVIAAACVAPWLNTASERSEEVLDSYKKAFGRFSNEETNLLDGIILEPEPEPAR
jgi:hypothetical protein